MQFSVNFDLSPGTLEKKSGQHVTYGPCTDQHTLRRWLYGRVFVNWALLLDLSARDVFGLIDLFSDVVAVVLAAFSSTSGIFFKLKGSEV